MVRGSNPVLWQVIGRKKSTTRRSFLVIPAGTTPRLLARIVDKEQFSEINIPAEYYVGWEDTQRMIKEMLRNCHKIAMEYSPNRSIPAISWVDGGVLELIRWLATIFSTGHGQHFLHRTGHSLGPGSSL